VFYVSYIFSELRRRKGRTLLTALGLGVGVGLVVAVSALSTALDRAQAKTLEPLTGVGTDMSVTRPIRLTGGGNGNPFEGLSDKERKQLQQENQGGRLDLNDAGDPGDKFSTTDFRSAQLSFPASTVQDIRGLDGVEDAAAGLTLSATTLSGTVPEGGFQTLGAGGPGVGPPPGGGSGSDDGGAPANQNINFSNLSITGMDLAKPALAPIGRDQVTRGTYLSDDGGRQVLLNVSYARTNKLTIGDSVTIKNKDYKVVGLVQAPLGGSASDAYMELGRLQTISDREGRVNTVQVRAEDTDAVAPVEREIRRTVDGASVTTASDLADRVGGSLSDAKSLSDKLGLALTAVALVAAFLIASLLTLSSVSKRVRELGTLKALGWPQSKVVRQVTAESLAQGALGGIIGAAIGIATVLAINAAGISLKATVAAQNTGGAAPGGDASGGFGPPGGGGGFGQGAVQSGSTSVVLDAPIDVGLIVLAISLAVLGGLVAGSAGGLRAARLRPAEALRHIG
jgi:ABC-type lipoprotein release transport system permease subunit